MADRWNRQQHGTKTVEELKERYYEVVALLAKAKNQTSEKKVFVYDVEHERRRKEQLEKLFKRTTQQVEEENMLINEMKKIEARKKERERKSRPARDPPPGNTDYQRYYHKFVANCIIQWKMIIP